jgi:hypothetical protein
MLEINTANSIMLIITIVKFLMAIPTMAQLVMVTLIMLN